jgi:hypothetical protein
MRGDDDSKLLDWIGEDAVVQALQRYAQSSRVEFNDVMSELFDVAGQQEVVSARPVHVRKIGLLNGHVVARVEFHVVYKNPVEDGDQDLSAENSTTDVFDVRFKEPGLDLSVDGIEPVLGETFAT